MKRKLTFKALNYSVRGIFFTCFFTVKMLKMFLTYINNVKTDILTGKGKCPNCNSLELEYYDPIVKPNETVHIEFNCGKCGKHGKEVYGFKYLKSMIKKGDSNGNSQTIRNASPNSARTTKTNKCTNKHS